MQVLPPDAQQQAQQQMQALQQQLQQPKWSDVLRMLNDDMQRAYRIDIETNSTIEPEAAEDQKQIAELLTSIGQFVQGVGPMVQQGIMPFGVAKNMLLAVSRRNRFGREIEDDIQAMQPPKPQDDGAAQKAAAAAAQQQIESQKKAAQDAATIAQLQTELKQLQGERALDERAKDLDVKDLALTTERNVFEMEKAQHEKNVKASTDSLNNKAALENTKIDQKKQVVALEGKAADEKKKSAKDVDTKITQGAKQVADAVSGLQSQVGQIAETVQQHTQQIAEVVKLARTPRKRKAIRDASGTLIGSEEEPMTEAV
jgi:hypothetical protein